nr:hypothetical protein [Tanacetum cinerariifolium]
IVVGVFVVCICWSASTVPVQMANPFAIIAPRWARTFMMALIDGGVAAAMAEAEASRVRNGYGSNGLGPRLAQAIHECTYPDFSEMSHSYMVELPCEDCYSGSYSGIAMENIEENDDRQVLAKGRNQEARN